MLRLLFPLVLIVAGLLAACGEQGGPETSGRGVKIVATTTQIGALVREVAGDQVELTVLLTAGADAHDYDPSPKAAKAVADAELVLAHGLGLDHWLDDIIENAGDTPVAVVTDGIEVRKGKHEEGDGGGGHAHEDDAHVWHNPQLAKVMVQNIAAALTDAVPSLADTFAANAQVYQAKLDATDAEIQRLIDAIPAANRKVVTNHDAFGHFLDRYGLEFVGAVIPTPNKDAQASARELADLRDLIEREGVKAIFAEAEVDPKVAKELSDDAGVLVVEGLYADSLGPPGSGAETIDGMLLFNARRFAEALK